MDAVAAFSDATLARIADPTVPDGCLVAQSALSSPTLEPAFAIRVQEMLRRQHTRVRSALEHAHSDKTLLDELAT